MHSDGGGQKQSIPFMTTPMRALKFTKTMRMYGRSFPNSRNTLVQLSLLMHKIHSLHSMTKQASRQQEKSESFPITSSKIPYDDNTKANATVLTHSTASAVGNTVGLRDTSVASLSTCKTNAAAFPSLTWSSPSIRTAPMYLHHRR